MLDWRCRMSVEHIAEIPNLISNIENTERSLTRLIKSQLFHQGTYDPCLLVNQGGFAGQSCC